MLRAQSLCWQTKRYFSISQEAEEQQPENATDIVENAPTETIEIEKDTKDINISVEKEVIVKEDIIVQEEEEDIVMEEANQPKQEQEPTLARTSSWTAVFSNIWDTLSSPFKPKK
ncbi:hypothetical protein RMATCC62417_18135 [Rhizopus microsporus]|nr:hypothetical protein RMATCC62417_18135 [Rhizopus microsporus]